MKTKGWKDYICHKMYCKPDLNRKLMCLKRSFEEVCEKLNKGSSCRK